MSAALVILIIGVGTYLERLSFIGIVGEREIPDWALVPLRYVAPAAFAAIVAPAVLVVDDRLTLSPAANPEALATVVALAAAWRTKNVAITVVVGMVALWVLQTVF